MLVDIVSKNGNLLLNIPVRGNITIDEKEIEILEGIADWMDINKESIYDTRPWKKFGEGPVADQDNPINAQGFNEGKIKFSAKDIRFNQKGKILYATILGIPTEDIVITSLAKENVKQKINKIEMLGINEKLSWSQTNDSLVICKPVNSSNNIAVVFKICFK